MARGSVSKINVVRRCKRRFWYQYILNLKPKIQSATPSRGFIGHMALEEYFKGKDWAEAIDKYEIDMENVFDEERQAWADMKAQVYKIVRGYVQSFGKVDSANKTLALELPFDIGLTSPNTKAQHRLTGRIDRVYQDEQGAWVEDHKFVSRIPETGTVYMDAQLGIYLPIVKHLQVADPVGVSFNFLRTKTPTEPKLLKSGGLSKAACDTDYYTYLDTIKKHGLDPEDYADVLAGLKENTFYRRVKFPMNTATVKRIWAEAAMSLDDMDALESLGDAADRYTPRTVIKNNCEWSCPYYKLCMAELAGTPSDSMKEDLFTRDVKPSSEDEDEEE